MKRLLISIFALCVWGLNLYAQSGEFDPASPGDPQPYYLLTVQVSPAAAGEANFSQRMVAVGQEVELYVMDYGYQFTFLQWVCGDSVISNDQRCSFTMPARNVVLTALYVREDNFNPPSPPDPNAAEEIGKHLVTVYSTPSIGGYTNQSAFYMREWEHTNLYAFNNAGYEFVGWYIGDRLESVSNPVTLTMQQSDITLTARFRFNPMSPGDPGANRFDATTGEVVIDRFEPGRLSDAVYTLLHDNHDGVTSVTVIGQMLSSDYEFYNSVVNFPNLETIDMSRTTGYTEIPAWAFSALPHLRRILLPASIESIGSDAFYGCSQLQEMVLYAPAPPTYEPEAQDYGEWGTYGGEDLFASVAGQVTVRVPSISIALYEASSVWNVCNILPMDMQSLQIVLPEDKVAIYRNMFLELMDTQNGQIHRYVITDRSTYTFVDVFQGTTYQLNVRNAQGRSFGQEMVALDKNDTTIYFTHLLQPLNIAVQVMAGEEDVTEQVTVTWRDNEGKYICKGATLDNLMENDIVAFQVALDAGLGSRYQQPAERSVVVSPQSPQILFRLDPVEERIFEGYVFDDATQRPVSNASVAIVQTVNGKYNKFFSGMTDNNGHFAIAALDAPSQLIVSASDYVKSTIDVPDSIEVQMVSLQRLTGTIISLDISYTAVSALDTMTAVQSGYTDFRNLSFAVFNRTQDRAIDDVEIRSASLLLKDAVSLGDSLEVTVSGLRNTFTPVTAGGRVSENNDMRIALSLVERGGVTVSCGAMPNVGAVAMLFNAAGEQTAQARFDEHQSATIEHMEAGLYTLILMQRCDRFGYLARLDDLAANQLQADTDYLTEQVQIQDGVTRSLYRDTVPSVNEQLTAYTDDATSFTTNKTTLTSGNYLTLRAQVTFKNQYKDDVDSVRLVVYLPDGVSLVENAILIGSTPVAYLHEGSQVIIPLPQNSEAVRFCVIPTLAGQFNINASVQFTLGDEQKTQTIGSAGFSVENASMQVQVRHSKSSVLLNGMTTPLSNVEVYDNGTLIGQTKAKAGGQWSIECELYMPYNLTTHELYAQILTPDGMRLQTKAESVFLNKECAVELLTVEMNLRNHGNWEAPITWDFVKGTKSTSYYTIDPGDMNFRFLANFTDNTSSLLSDVYVLIYMEGQRIQRLSMTYNANLDRWVGLYNARSTNDCPVNVGIEYKLAGVSYSLDATYMNEVYELLEARNQTVEPTIVDTLLMQLDLAIAAEDYNTVDSIFALLVPDEQTVGDEEEELDVNRLIQEYDSIAQTPLYQTDFSLDMEAWMDSISEWTRGITIADCQGIDTTQLGQAGYERMRKTDSTFIYVLVSENEWHMVDVDANVSYHVDLTSDALVPRQIRTLMMDVRADGSFIADMQAKIAAIEKVRQEITDKLYAIREKYVSILRFFHLDDRVEFISTCKDAVEGLANVAEKVDNALATQNNVLKKENSSITDFLYRGMADDHPAVKNKLQEIRRDNSQKIMSNLKWRKNWALMQAQVGNGLKRVCAVFNLTMTAASMVDDMNQCVNVYMKAEGKIAMLDCTEGKSKLYSLQTDIIITGTKAGAYYVIKIGQNSAELASIIYSLFAAIPSGGTSLVGAVVAGGAIALDIGISMKYSQTFKARMKYYNEAIDKVKCKEDDPEPPQEDHQPTEQITIGPMTTDLGKGIDPSGFVYEATESNRIQGVQASIYYKGSRENIFGEIVEEDVLWDASEFDQENPLYTDEDGMYRWDVPQGLWQVRFEKEGYEPTQSEWLPVPPPQLEVNIPMVQLRQPEVIRATAMKDAIEMTFDKYMQPSGLTTENIFVTANDEVIAGTIELLDEQASYEDPTVTYASKVRFVPNEVFTANEVTLTVSNRVRSYANVTMAQTFQQTFDIENSDVMQQVEAPTASLPSGTVVEQGTEITLSCATEGAVIRYTMDESTPDCVSGYIYAQPLVLFGQHQVIITAVACAEGYNPSEPVQWYYLFEGGTDVQLIETADRPYKILDHDRVIIIRNGERYDVTGRRLAP